MAEKYYPIIPKLTLALIRAKAAGRVAKTDALNAQDIAHFGEALQPRLTNIKPESLRNISDLSTVRSQYLDMTTM